MLSKYLTDCLKKKSAFNQATQRIDILATIFSI